ncbi:hypothetical protein [Sulfitobacter profundi]
MILVALLFALGGCLGRNLPAAVATPPALPERALAPCPAPGEFLAAGPMARAEFEIAVGRMGYALAACGGEKAALVAFIKGALVDLSRSGKD